MQSCKLRVYDGPDGEEAFDTTGALRTKENTVEVSLGEILPLLADAVRSKRTWLRDFERDPVRIPSDLYEVILAYRHFRPSA